jgi:uncharacterized protein with beta-barrel porin domain
MRVQAAGRSRFPFSLPSLQRVAAILAFAVTLATAAHAQTGGQGGGNFTGGGGSCGGAAGASSATGVGGAGGTGPCVNDGGGGGGAGTTGGRGGTSPGGSAGGAGGVSGVDGGAGAAGASPSGSFGAGGQGGGGGGGAHGVVVTTNSALTTSVTGGTGGAGGDGVGDAGGGGGAGGYGVVVNGANATVNAAMTGGTGGAGGTSQNPYGANGGDGGFGVAEVGLSTITNNSIITGGNGGVGGINVGCCPSLGGNGGNGAAGVSLASGSVLVNSATIIGGNGGAGGNTTDANNNAAAGNGGNGGAGVTGANATITNRGSITGGVGGAAGTGITNGSAGPSGAGISGSDLEIINSGSISGTSGANAITFTGGSNSLNLEGGWRLTGNVAVDGSSSVAFTQTASVVLSNAITGTGTIINSGSGTLVLSGNNTYSGGTIVNAGMLQLSGSGTLGATSGTTTVNAGGTLDLGGTTQTQAVFNLAGGTLRNGSVNGAITSTGGTISGIGGAASLSLTGGMTIVSGTDTFTGGTTVTNATLTVNGALSDPTIGAGGLLNGTGSLGGTTIQSGGTFAPGSGAPGTSMTVNGNLALQSGATYQVAINPSTASFANVTGTATLGGAAVNALFANGGYISKQYTILSAGSVSGTFGSLANSNLPTNFADALSYDATHAYLNLTLNFTPSGPTAPNFGGGLNLNQQAVGNALINYFNTTGGIPMVYGALNAAGLTQASGELATASQQTTFDAMNLFMGLLTDPFMNRTGGAGPMPGASGYAEAGDASAYAATRKTDAFAMFAKAPPLPFVQRWSVWAAGFGGSQSTSGNAIVGSNDTTSNVYGTAVGADYLFSPNTIAGFAIAGGGTNFSVVNSGSGRSDLFQAGVYIRHTEGPAYISAALAYGWQDITTDRTVTAAGFDQLRAEFNANAYSGRVEGGYRFVAPWTDGIGITPYAAGQFTTFDLPDYAEQVISGLSTFALGYAGRSVTDTRSELGFRTDKSFAVQDGILTLRTRFAWAHDYDPNRSIAATFQALPGASFVVNGAPQASESALTTASVEMKWRNGWSAAATFEGEFSDVTSSYAGKGVVRYQW